jgi:DNA-binding MurR/RpiR family transcriptional regulator
MRKRKTAGRPTHMLPFVQRIEARQATMTRSERVVAAYLKAHARELPFETAASVARKVGVSQMTVGRLLRALGYGGFAALKSELSSSLRQVPWLVGERYERMTRAGETRGEAGRNLSRSLDLELKSLVSVYEVARTERFAGLAGRIATAEHVFIAGFQTVRGLAMDCAQRLEYARPGVRFLDGANGTYSELFANGENAQKVLLVVDIRRYARQAVLLAQEASRRGIHVAAVTDAVCDWAAHHAGDVFQIATDVDLFWDSNGPLTSFLNLLVDETMRQIGPAIRQRIETLQSLQGEFEAFNEPLRQTP